MPHSAARPGCSPPWWTSGSPPADRRASSTGRRYRPSARSVTRGGCCGCSPATTPPCPSASAPYQRSCAPPRPSSPRWAAVRGEMEGHRLQYMATIARWLAERAGLRVPEGRAAQIVWALASPDVARMLCDVQGWTTGEYAAWLEETLAATLLTDE